MGGGTFMSTMEPTVEHVQKMLTNFITENVISREDFPTDVKVHVFWGTHLGYSIGVLINHDNYERKYHYNTDNSRCKDLVKDVKLFSKIDNDVFQFTQDYFNHCTNDRIYQIKKEK
jgi:hypothetical protein